MSKPVPLDLTLAAAGLPITAEQFRFFLSQDDLADIAAGLIPVECLRAYAERFSKRLPVAVDDDRVCCAGCAHFERLDRPHMGRCAAGKGRHWLWDTDRRECKDFEAAGALNVAHSFISKLKQELTAEGIVQDPQARKAKMVISAKWEGRN